MARLPRPIDLINGPAALAGLKVTRHLPYGEGPRRRLDLYRPARAAGRLPTIVFFYGGAWQSGERASFGFVAARLARRGFLVAVPDYRVFPEVRFPGFLEDAAQAAAWMLGHAEAHGGDAGSMFLMGHSAGAYNAVMLALAPEYLRAAGASAARLAGVIGLAGPYDFLPLGGSTLRKIFETGGELAQTQPIGVARGDAPPLFLLTGGADRVVLPRNTAALAARLRALGGTVETRIYPGIGHVGIITALLSLLSWRAPVLRDVLGFIAACRAGEFAPAHSDAAERLLG